MPGLDVAELMVANGSLVAAAPPGTASPALGTPPATPWVDLGYIDEDGVTYGDSPDEQPIPAWQSADPVLILITAMTRTFAFNLMQWNPDVLAFAIGGAMVGTPPAAEFVPGAAGRGAYALLLAWEWNAYRAQFYSPRGKVTGDVEAQLVRTDTANFGVTFTCTPDKGAAEDVWKFSSDHPAFSGAITLRSDGSLVKTPAPTKAA